MKKKDYISSFEEAISPLFPSGKVGLGALRGAILDELQEALKAKKISDAKNAEISRIKNDLLKEIYETLETEFPEISHYMELRKGSVELGGFGSDCIKILTYWKDINSSLDHKECFFNDRPFSLGYGTFSTLEEMYESDEFCNLIKKYYTKLELGKINTSK